VLTVETMHPLVKNVEYAVRGALPIRAEALSLVNISVRYKKMELCNNSTSLFSAIKERSIKVKL
jgi:hypothetical protein